MIPLEIERKFLIRRTASIEEHASHRIDIIQTYLVKTDEDIQRRVRKTSVNGDISYTYTEKRFVSPSVREENERVINEKEYLSFLCETDNELQPVEKSRFILPYRSQRFEIDVYPFSDEFATLELELASEDQDIYLPPFLDIIKEVTGDHSYSNAVLAKNKRFPEITPTRG